MSKMGSVGSYLGSLLSLLTRLLLCLVQYSALAFSLAFSTYLIGKYTNRAIQSRKEVLELVYWRDPKKSGALLAALFLGLFLFQKYSIHGIFVYGALGLLSATVGFRLLKMLEGHFKKTTNAAQQPQPVNPFQQYLDAEVNIQPDKLHAHVDTALDHAIFLFKKMRHIYLVENFIDSVKFGILLYSLTYVVSWFSGLGLLVLFIVAIFTLPKTYELYKEPIDSYIKLAKEQLDNFSNLAQEKLPFLAKVSERNEPEKKEE